MSSVVPGFLGISGMTLEERLSLLDHIPSKGKFLEVGTLDGATCAFLAEYRPGVDFLCLDPFVRGSEHIANWHHNRQPNMNLFFGTLDELAGRWGFYSRGAVFDIVLIDGNHRFKSALSDIEIGSMLVGPGGLLLVHDFKGHARHKGVDQAVAEFCKSNLGGWKLTGRFETIRILEAKT